MPDLKDGESIKMQGSGANPYVLKNVGGVYSCTCPAWRNQSSPIERRTCKHLRKLRGDAGRGGPHRRRPAAQASGRSQDVHVVPMSPPLLLAERWDNVGDLTGWWMSEKLDGVRAYWDGKQFLSRLGNRYHAPDWFLAGLPDVPLDGELWLGRKKFQRTVSIVRRQDKSDHWKQVRSWSSTPRPSTTFREASEICARACRTQQPPFASRSSTQVCKGLDHLRAELARIEALGGEGLMLRQPGSKYDVGRSTTLLKVKTFHDADAQRRRRTSPGAGRHKGRLGALLVELANGTASRSAPASPTPSATGRRRSAASSPSAIRNCPTAACRAFRAMSVSVSPDRDRAADAAGVFAALGSASFLRNWQTPLPCSNPSENRTFMLLPGGGLPVGRPPPGAVARTTGRQQTPSAWAGF